MCRCGRACANMSHPLFLDHSLCYLYPVFEVVVINKSIADLRHDCLKGCCCHICTLEASESRITKNISSFNVVNALSPRVTQNQFIAISREEIEENGEY